MGREGMGRKGRERKGRGKEGEVWEGDSSASIRSPYFLLQIYAHGLMLAYYRLTTP